MSSSPSQHRKQPIVLLESYVYQESGCEKADRLKRCPACRLNINQLCDRHKDYIDAESYRRIRRSHEEYERWEAEEYAGPDPPIITYETVNDVKMRIETYPNGTKVTRRADTDIPVEHIEDTEENFLSTGDWRPATEEETRECEEAVKPPTCEVCGVGEPLGRLFYSKNGFLHDTCKEPEPKPKPKPVITYEIRGDEKVMLETYPDRGLSKSVGKASKHEKVVILAQETYDKVLNITDHKTACDMMAYIFTTLLPTRCEHSY